MTAPAVAPDQRDATGAPVGQEALDRPVQEEYFGYNETERFVFPDGVTYIDFKRMNEGDKAKFQKRTQRDFVMERVSGNTRVRVDPSEERHALIKTCVTGWNLVRGGNLIPFNDRNLNDFLALANPKIVEDIEKAIRKANPWLMQDMSVEDIDREIENLQEMRKVAEERERGE